MIPSQFKDRIDPILERVTASFGDGTFRGKTTLTTQDGQWTIFVNATPTRFTERTALEVHISGSIRGWVVAEDGHHYRVNEQWSFGHVNIAK